METGNAELARRATALSLAQQCELLTGCTSWRLPSRPNIGLRELVFSDGPAGVRGTSEKPGETSISLPSPTALAATWDPALVRRVGHLFAAEARRHGVDIVLAPVVNIQRSPVGGRHFENYSEDPWLVGEIGCALMTGMQERGVAACVKHFVANETETLRTEYISRMDEATLREVYLAPFERAVKDAGVWALMSSYNRLDFAGVIAPTGEHAPLLLDVLKGEWGFDGIVVSDWTATKHGLEAALGGQDVVMPGPESVWSDGKLLALVESGHVSRDSVTDKVIRILRLAGRVGALRGIEPSPGHEKAFQSGEDDLPRLLASRSIVVLKDDDGVLGCIEPESIRTLALIGPNAVDTYMQGGGSAHVEPAETHPAREAFAEAFPQATITVSRGVDARVNPPELDWALATDPVTGTPGVRLELLDGGGNVVSASTADRMDPVLRGLPEATAAIRISATIALREPGDHWIGAATVGAHAIEVDGETVSESSTLVGGEVFINSSVNTPPAHGRVVSGPGVAHIQATCQYIHGGGWGNFARLSLYHRLPGLSADEEMAEAVEVAASADVTVVIVGTTEETESEGWDRTNLDLPGRQNDLVRAVLGVCPDAVIVVNAGAPVILPWLDKARTVLWAWFPGQEGARGIADVVSGRAEPTGRLPWTLPATLDDVPVPDGLPNSDLVIDYTEGVDVGYRGWLRSGKTPARPFGYGLGWTTWEYGEVRVLPDGATVEVDVTNVGARAGHEVVQIYLEASSTPDADHPRPLRWLAGAGIAHCEPAQTVTVSISIPDRAFEVWDIPTHSWITPPGVYTVVVGRDLHDQRGMAELTR